MTLTDPDLEDLLEGDYDDEPAIEIGWRIRDDQTADRWLRKIARRRREIARLKAIAKARHEEVTAWLEARTRITQGQIDRQTAQLVEYRHHLEDADPALPKTYQLPSGGLVRKKARQTVEVTDIEAFAAWCDSTGTEGLLRVKLEVDKQAVAGAALSHRDLGNGVTELYDGLGTGHTVPGVCFVRPDDEYRVDTPKDAA